MTTTKQKKNSKIRHLEYYDLQNTPDTLYADSGRGKIFNNLMPLIESEENIRLAYRNIKRNSGSNTSGIDRLTIKDIEKISEIKFVEIVRKKLQWYKPKAVRRVEIPKPNGKLRPLGIPAIWDRIVQQCILQILEPICEAKFSDRSNGFRPNRSAEHAIAQAYAFIALALMVVPTTITMASAYRALSNDYASWESLKDAVGISYNDVNVLYNDYWMPIFHLSRLRDY